VRDVVPLTTPPDIEGFLASAAAQDIVARAVPHLAAIARRGVSITARITEHRTDEHEAPVREHLIHVHPRRIRP
jgi:hypothetical protein